MNDVLRQSLFDPPAARALVLARRRAQGSVVQDVVSDLVWQEVVQLLRWATAATRSPTTVPTGVYWRLAASCADLLRRLPRLCGELGEPWDLPAATDAPPDVTGIERVAGVTDRLAVLLQNGCPVPLARLAADVDELGAAAIEVIADRWRDPSPLAPATRPTPSS